MVKKAKFKKMRKLNLLFDEKEKKDFLLGFQKRKADRKLKAKERLENDLREVKRQLKKEKKNYLSKLYLDNSEQNEQMANALQPVTCDFGEQTLTISSLDTNEIGGILNLSMGYNKYSLLRDNDEGAAVEEKHEEKLEEKSEEKSEEKNEAEPVTDRFLKQIKKKQFRTLKKNKAYQRMEKMKQKNLNKKKSRKKMNKKHAKSKSKKNKKFRQKF